MSQISEADLRFLHSGNDQVLVMLDWAKSLRAETHTYDHFSDCIERGIRWSISQIEENPKDALNRTENDLTREVVGHLRCMGFTVEFDGTVGGHCDLVARHQSMYMWQGEAKRYTDYGWLEHGYQQLLTRYSRGDENSDRGGMLIYFQKGKTASVMEKWKQKLTGNFTDNPAPISVEDVNAPPYCFVSTQDHRRSSRPYKVVHFPVSLQWDPEV